MKKYTKPVAEIKEFGLSAAIANLGEYLGANGVKLGIDGVGAIASYSKVS